MTEPLKAEYDRISQQWLEVRTQLPAKDMELFKQFVGLFDEPSKILDLGCGHATPIGEFLAGLGHSLVGVDRSKKLLAMAKERLPNQQWVLSELEEYEIDQTYDGVVLWDSLFHLPRVEQKRLLESAYQSLRSGGACILSSGGSEVDIPPFTDYMFEVEFYYDAYPIPQFIEICQQIGFRVVEWVWVNEPDGMRDKGRIGVLLIKP
ncbi:class I SAM-dependent methyltransferase [Vibrio sp. SCSIO 43135]|uniref:Class I SAM-dependent methyltransferase n=1 Tax=Vibrio paucivorans TaxID=2829489 RepID=A0A9X3CE35_9VIBR|nr:MULTISPECIES: class I SAM-dependent methyltransferase [Vibrio]MCW8334142.1 class I SAM-dependent methyltransferase [Vibrio paucivorans]USD42933.1 class I SAM-dependent methyltransferase [Vibrio sp. SCSIO 43135]